MKILRKMLSQDDKIKQFISNVALENAHDAVIEAIELIIVMDPDTVSWFISEPVTYLSALLSYCEYHEEYEYCSSLKRVLDYVKTKVEQDESVKSNNIN